MLASKNKISTRQAVIIFLTIVYSPAIRLFPVFSARIAQQAGWLTPIFAALPFVGLIYMLQDIFKGNHQDMNLSDVFMKVLGKIGGKVLLTIYLLWFMVLFGLYVRYFAERFLTALLPNTPMPFFIVTMLAVVFYVGRGSITAFARTLEFLLLLFSVIYVIIFLLSLTNIDIINLLPVTYYDIWPLTKSTYPLLGIWGYLTFIFFMGDQINDKEHIRKFGLQGTGYLVISAIILLVQTIGIHGYTLVERFPLPYFNAVKSISLLDSIERIESVALAFWEISDFAVISAFMFMIMSIMKSIFSLSETKFLVSPLIVFAYLFSFYICRSLFELTEFSQYIGLPVNIILSFIVPFIVYIIGKVRKVI